MEITPVDSDYTTPPEEKVGKALLYTFSTLAICAAAPAFFPKKKRVYSILSQAAPIELVEIENAPVPCCTAEEERKVKEIFRTTAAGGWTLMANSLRLKQLGKEINHIHPFAFLMAAPKESVRKIFREGNRFVKNGVMRGVVIGMERGNLNGYVPSFAAAMGKTSEQVSLLIRARNWEKLVHYLFDIEDAHEE